LLRPRPMSNDLRGNCDDLVPFPSLRNIGVQPASQPARKPTMLQAIISLSLRQVLLLDAVATGATALLLGLGAGLLAGPLGLPEALLHGAGLILVPFVVLVAWTASR